MSGHLPFMQFYPADWLADTRALSLEARGAWIDLLCAMWTAPERGKLEWTIEMFENFVGYPRDRDASTSVWNELLHSGIGELILHDNGQRVTLMSRRMIREESQRNQARERQSRKRHANVTGKSRRIYQKSEVRSHKSEEDTLVESVQKKPDMSVQEFVESWNEIMSPILPAVVLPLSPSRHRKAQARLKEHLEMSFWEQVFRNVLASDFLTGKRGSWKASFDFIIANDSNCLKIYEGGYSNGKNERFNGSQQRRFL